MMWPFCKTVWQIFEKSIIKLYHYPAIPLLSIYAREIKANVCIIV